MTDKVRPVIPEKLVAPLMRFAISRNINTTAAVALLLTAALKKEKQIK